MQNAKCKRQNVGRLRLIPLTLYNKNQHRNLYTELRADFYFFKRSCKALA